MGRNTIPTKIKEARGTLRKCRTVKNEVKAEKPDKLPSAPPSLNTYGRKIWKNLISFLDDNKILFEVDLIMMESYCFNAQMAKKASEKITEDGEVVEQTNKYGATNLVKSPWVQIYLDSIKKLSEIGSKFGLSPADRTRLSMGGKEDNENPFTRFGT